MRNNSIRVRTAARQTKVADAHSTQDVAAEIRARILNNVTEVRILDPTVSHDFIQQRQERDIDKYDEVWEGVYVVPVYPTNEHQDIVTGLVVILHPIVALEGGGRVQAGANVSDRRVGWDHNVRGPDVVVVLKDGKAVDCGTHWFGGPDFLVEVKSGPRDKCEEKIPFYSRIGVRELLIIHRETRQLWLYRHDGSQLVEVETSDFKRSKWLVSEVVPLAFRPKSVRGDARTEVQGTDGKAGKWFI